jgi:hypothetical protein
VVAPDRIRIRVLKDMSMGRRLVDSVSGTGSVHAGDLMLRSIAYTLSFWVDDDASARPEGPVPMTVDGHIDISGMGEAAVLAGPEALTLTLEDGRRITFRLKSTFGDIVGSWS